MYPVLWTRVNLGPRGGSFVYDSIIVTLLFKPNGSLRQRSQKKREIIFARVSECNHSDALWAVNGSAFLRSSFNYLYLDQGEAFSSHLELKGKRRHNPLTKAWMKSSNYSQGPAYCGGVIRQNFERSLLATIFSVTITIGRGRNMGSTASKHLAPLLGAASHLISLELVSSL